MMIKITIDPRPDDRKTNRKTMSVEEIIESVAADWDIDDPGVGRAVLTPDGREIFNPVPMAPPVGYIDQPSIFDQLYAKLRAEIVQAKADEIVDTVESMNDFPDDDEPTFFTDYELVMRDEFPEMPPVAPGAPGSLEEPPKKEEPPESPPEAPGAS